MPVSQKKSRGFTLIEIIVSIGIFALFSIGIYSSIQFLLKIVYQSKIKIIESGIANEQIEIIRNIPFANIGLTNGVPSGVLAPTVSSTRNGYTFLITRTIRNIDDPFDGTIGGSPNDLAPADYKLVEVSVLCTSCHQTIPVVLSTNIAPKYLEGDSTKGTVFVRVQDASGEPVQGASVHVTATLATSTVDIIDVTNNSGLLALVDLPPKMNGYSIVVTKNGYTTDQTIVPTIDNPNPEKQPISVIAQSVIEATFSIDLVSSMTVNTINNLCLPVATVGVSVKGTRLIGVAPDVSLVNSTVTTNGSGVYALTNYPWDLYSLVPSGYDLLGSIPMVPVTVQPGADVPIQLVLGANTSRSLLVGVRDSITLQPISDALVHITGVGYDQTKTTGVGYIRQTDWSSGAGQESMNNTSRYFSDDGHIAIDLPTGSITLKANGQEFYSGGVLESSTYDLGLIPNYITLIWEPLAQPAETGEDPVRFQIATSNTSTPLSWQYLGPDGTTSTFYTAQSGAIAEAHDGDQFLRYKVYMQTASPVHTPTVSDMTISYTNSCVPPGQAYYGSLSNQAYTIDVTKSGYQTHTRVITVDDDIRQVIDLSPN